MGDATKPWRNWYHCMGNTYGTWLPGDERGFRVRHHREHVQGDYRFPPPPGEYENWLAVSQDRLPRGAVVIPPELRQTVCGVLGDALRFYQVEIVELSMGGVHWHLLARFVPVGMDPYVHLMNLGIRWIHNRKTSRAQRTIEESPPAPAGGASSDDRKGTPPAGAGGLSVGRELRWHAYDVDPAPRRILGLARSYATHALKKRGLFTHVPGGLWAQRPKCVPIADRAHQVAVAHYIRRHAKQGSALYSELSQ